MKAIKIERKDKTIAIPWVNPFRVYSTQTYTVLSGRLVEIDTGIKIQLPAGSTLQVEQVRNDISVIGYVVRSDDSLVVFATLSGNCDTVLIKPKDELAGIRVISYKTDDVRFIDFTGGERMICGGPRPLFKKPKKSEVLTKEQDEEGTPFEESISDDIGLLIEKEQDE